MLPAARKLLIPERLTAACRQIYFTSAVTDLIHSITMSRHVVLGNYSCLLLRIGARIKFEVFLIYRTWEYYSRVFCFHSPDSRTSVAGSLSLLLTSYGGRLE